MTKSNILDFMYADLVLDNQWSLAEQFCALIKQNQSDQAIISSFQSLRTAYLLETLTMFRSAPMSADFVKKRDNENKLIDATHVASIVKAVCAAIAYEKENKEAVIAAIKKIADYHTSKPEKSIAKWFTEAMETIVIEKVSEIKTQEELEKSNKAIESVIFWTNLFCEQQQKND